MLELHRVIEGHSLQELVALLPSEYSVLTTLLKKITVGEIYLLKRNCPTTLTITFLPRLWRKVCSKPSSPCGYSVPL